MNGAPDRASRELVIGIGQKLRSFPISTINYSTTSLAVYSSDEDGIGAYPGAVKVKMSNFRLKRQQHKEIRRDFIALARLLGATG